MPKVAAAVANAKARPRQPVKASREDHLVLAFGTPSHALSA
ncbi:hypothetical protein [Labrys sp. LIt4]|nr:hypothetical protein [Labrys sp. LIt4]